MCAYYRCPEGHVFRRTPSQMAYSNHRTKCGRCGENVTAIPCPEAEPRPATKRNGLSPSILRQRDAAARKKRAVYHLIKKPI